jgi:hypothetical protein
VRRRMQPSRLKSSAPPWIRLTSTERSAKTQSQFSKLVRSTTLRMHSFMCQRSEAVEALRTLRKLHQFVEAHPHHVLAAGRGALSRQMLCRTLESANGSGPAFLPSTALLMQ